MGNRFFLFCSFILLACFSVQAQVSFGEAKKFNENWLFSLSDDSLGASASYDDSKWRKLDLPHDWSVEGQLSPSGRRTAFSFTGKLYRLFAGWYRLVSETFSGYR